MEFNFFYNIFYLELRRERNERKFRSCALSIINRYSKLISLNGTEESRLSKYSCSDIHDKDKPYRNRKKPTSVRLIMIINGYRKDEIW